MKDCSVNIGKKKWKIKFVKSADMSRWSWGECDYPNVKNPQIWIKKSLPPKVMLNTIVHEVIHAIRPELSEEAVIETADTIEKVLIKCGLDPSSLKIDKN